MVTIYNGPDAEKAMITGLVVVYEYSELIMDLMATFLGYMAWCQSTDYQLIQLNYEIIYYIFGFIRDLGSIVKSFHHILALSYIYFGWQFKTSVSRSLFFGSISTSFLSLMMKHPNTVTKISFVVSFVIMRIIIGAWLMKKTLELPVDKKSFMIIPVTGSLYILQWWWLKKIMIKVSHALYPNGSGATDRS
jgi:hypothetical protein